MTRVLITLLCAVLLASCATPARNYSNNAEYMAAHGIVPTDTLPPLPMEPTTPKILRDEHGRPWMAGTGDASSLRIPTPPQSTGPSALQVIGGLIALPLLIPILALSAYPSTSTHCYSYTYKDQYHVKCYLRFQYSHELRVVSRYLARISWRVPRPGGISLSLTPSKREYSAIGKMPS
jgi:hypothetical protein